VPQLEAYFHYRYLDVSTLKELARRWKPEILDGFKKQGPVAVYSLMKCSR
jgi:oligoribonuclease